MALIRYSVTLLGMKVVIWGLVFALASTLSNVTASAQVGIAQRRLRAQAGYIVAVRAPAPAPVNPGNFAPVRAPAAPPVNPRPQAPVRFPAPAPAPAPIRRSSDGPQGVLVDPSLNEPVPAGRGRDPPNTNNVNRDNQAVVNNLNRNTNTNTNANGSNGGPDNASTTLKPTETTKPTETPKPNETPEPIEIPKASEKPKPTETSKPTETPKPTETLQPAPPQTPSSLPTEITELLKPTQTKTSVELPITIEAPVGAPKPMATSMITQTPKPTERLTRTKTPKSTQTSSSQASKWPTGNDTVTLQSSKVIEVGQVFDGKMKRYKRPGEACKANSESKSDDAMFVVKPGGTLKNAIIAGSSGVSVWCAENNCNLDKVFFEGACQAAVMIAQGQGTTKINGGGARNTKSRVVLHKGSGDVTVSHFMIESTDELVESCGTCGPVKRQFMLSNIDATKPRAAIARVNKNYHDEAKLSNVVVKGVSSSFAFCAKYDGGKTPKKVGEGKEDKVCAYVNDVRVG